MAKDEQDLFIKEVDEELKRDQYAKLWKKYGNYVVGLAFAVVLSTAGWQGWAAYRQDIREAQGEKFAAALALARDGKPAEAESAFAELAGDAGAGYEALARLQGAALLVRQGNLAAAISAYEALAADEGGDPLLRDLARLLSVLYDLDKGDTAALAAKLEPLIADDNAWRYSALELSAIVAERAGDRPRARDILTRLGDDAAAPPRLRARAKELLSGLGGR